MEMMFEACMTYEAATPEPDDFPRVKDTVWLLGKKYDTIQDLESLRVDVRSRLWFTYRKGFVAIGDTSVGTDKGWGCMLRCGQMVLGQALILHHLGREWRWNPATSEKTYLRIIQMFEDTRRAPYSIHQIALMGQSEGKEVGQWFGPNTVAQVLRKLVQYDKWSNITIHVAMDNTVVVEDIKQQCRISTDGKDGWRPLLLVIPLRLGLSEMNDIYVDALKSCFKFHQSVGVIGGKPNHALYFIGYVGEEVVFLDPHTTQTAAFVDSKDQEHQKMADESYHCPYASRMHFLHMDPSVAVCFFCKTEVDFDCLSQAFQKQQMGGDHKTQALFEVCEQRPEPWAPSLDLFESSLEGAACLAALDDSDRQLNSEEDFEFLG